MKLQLSISMLVSDSLPTVRRCLDSLVPILHTIPSELIIVFTGKNPDVLKIAEEYAHEVIPFDWCDDFSMARNVGLRKATGDWFLFLDDDEWFEDTAEIIQFFQSGEYKVYDSACYGVRSYTDKKNIEFVESINMRMAKRTADLRFESSVHEYLTPLGPNLKVFQDYVHHIGYVYTTKEDKQAKFNRNVPLINQEIKKNPNSARNYIQLAQEYSAIGDWSKCEQICRDALKIERKYWEENRYNWIFAVLPRLIMTQGNNERAASEGKRILEQYRPRELPSAYICLYLTQIYDPLGSHDEVLRYTDLLHFYLEKLDADPCLVISQQALGITKDFLDQNRYCVYLMGVDHAISKGDFEKAFEFVSWLPWNTDEMKDDYYNMINSYKKKSVRLLDILSKLDGDDCYLLLQKALYYERNENKADTELYYRECIDCETIRPFLKTELLLLALRNQFPLDVCLLDMPPEVWNLNIGRIADQVSFDELYGLITDCDRMIKPIDSIRDLEMKMVLYEQILNSYELEDNKLMDTMNVYCGISMDYFGSLYHEKLFTGGRQYLPRVCQFTLLIRDAMISYSSKDYLNCLKLLNKSVKLYTKMSLAIKKILNKIRKELDHPISEAAVKPMISKESGKPDHKGSAINPNAEASEEFILLGKQVKNEIKKLIKECNYKDALSVLDQLAALLPGDQELLNLRAEIENGLEIDH